METQGRGVESEVETDADVGIRVRRACWFGRFGWVATTGR